ncbi:MAG: hypothetical protein WC294_08040 [Methanoregula sp.]|jgi:GNAT superfamily N-acetyltransferase
MNFRILERKDIDNTISLMNKIKPDIAGSRDTSLYRALCEDSFKDERLVIVVGEDDSKIVAFFIAVIDPVSWKLSFALRHPIIGIGRGINKGIDRIKRKLRKPEKVEAKPFPPELIPYITAPTTDKSWSDSSYLIAKLLFDAVDEQYRGRGIAKDMREFMLDKLVKLGVRRVDGLILFNNISSLRVSHAKGFEIYNRGDQLFVTQDISGRSSWVLL